MKHVVMAGLIVLLVTALLGSPTFLRAQEAQDDAASALDQAIADLEAATPSAGPQAPGLAQRTPRRAPQLRLIDVALDVMLYAGFSSENDDSISTLQGGAHDPKSRGYTLGQAELSLSGVVDPYFTADAHILSLVNTTSGESVFEVEEAFLTTTGLPFGLQLEVGYFLTEFGIINAQHPHVWDWLDMPVVNSRMFGGDGMRQGGFRASWLLNTPWFSQLHFGMQNANGVTMASFLGGELAHAHGGNGHGHGAKMNTATGRQWTTATVTGRKWTTATVTRLKWTTATVTITGPKWTTATATGRKWTTATATGRKWTTATATKKKAGPASAAVRSLPRTCASCRTSCT